MSAYLPSPEVESEAVIACVMNFTPQEISATVGICSLGVAVVSLFRSVRGRSADGRDIS